MSCKGLQQAGRHAVLAPRHQLTRQSVRRTCQPVRAKQQESEQAEKTEGNVAFRWDPGNLRWAKVEGKTNPFSDEDMWIKPLIGQPYLVWPAIWQHLVNRGLKSLPPQEVGSIIDHSPLTSCNAALAMAHDLQQSGKALLVDIRAPNAFEAQHIAGAVHVGLFRRLQGRSQLENVKRIAMGLLAMEATERNPDFQDTALATLPKDKQLIVYCGLGGTIKTGTKPVKLSGKSFAKDPDRVFGRETRSLKACYELLEAGFTNVSHLEGGISQWRYDGLPLESS